MNNAFKKIISILLMLTLFATLFSAQAAGFQDVKPTAWYRISVEYAQRNGYMQGVSIGRFAPDKTITRAMLATVLYRMSGSTETYSKSSFSDTKKGKWYFDGIEFCYRHGIVLGYDDGSFAPEETLMRQDMMVMIYRYARYMGVDVEASGELSEALADREQVRPYARKGVLWCMNQYVINGTDATHVSPLGSATRAQLAQVLMNYDEWIEGVSMSEYRQTDANPYGLGIRGARLEEDQLLFRLYGMPDGLEFTVEIDYLINGQILQTGVRQIGDSSYFTDFREDASPYRADATDTGKKFDRSVEIRVYHDGQPVYRKACKLGAEIITSTSKEKLYFKGEKTIDSRILLYHEFSEEEPAKSAYSTTTTAEKFEADLVTMLNQGYQIIPLYMLAEYERGERALPAKSVILTVDDGYLSNYTLLFPILQKYKVHATIFVTAANMGVAAHKMTWEQMLEMEQSGLVDIQSHSWEHEDHTMLPESILSQYVEDSFALIEEKLGEGIRIFAYPHGKYNALTCEMVSFFDVALQVGTQWRALDMDRLDLLALPRLNVAHNAEIKQILKISK